ncbi:MAG: tRNA (guanosine(37)-N1)-methyltransferase TrmD [Phycisphaerales bacterium]|jgi:tRNA (guanine37-N1)-methyltransferase|nr:tRNA (guanosine(37)-N1)-methyltransferase TrmD [Phycisphaerales bacterium]
MRIDILTLFPDSFPPVLDTSIVGRAQEAGHVEIVLHNIRDWADNTHNKVDDRPFGGGPGMVLMCQPLHDAVRAAEQEDERPARRILLSPQGERLTQERVEELASEQRLLLIAGHYEGVDERVIDELEPLELSVGDFVLSGGEIPAMLLTDAVTRLLPGVLGHEQSAAEDSFARRGSEGTRLLDCPHYTRPRSWMGRGVPEVLLGGDHGAVDQWRMEQMKERTQQRRPDLLQHEEV